MNEYGRMSQVVQVILWTIVAAILIFFCWPSYGPSDHTRHRESEIKASLHTIQVALERYYTDHGEYPGYLLSGDMEGWGLWHDQFDSVNEIVMEDGKISTNAAVIDPLIELSYLYEYPRNPFVDGREESRFILESTAPGVNPINELGDPRFGVGGRCMGMGLDDPNWFAGALQTSSDRWSEIETRRTLDNGDWMNVPDTFIYTGKSSYYQFGGHRDQTTGDTTQTHWPGSFFYRALSKEASQIPVDGSFYGPGTGIYETYEHYILGGYGGGATSGLDVIRLTQLSADGSQINWRYPANDSGETLFCGFNYPQGWETSGGLPAVFGGGDESTGPQYPYFDPTTGDVIYGAPDGIPDGVIFVLRDGEKRFSSFQLDAWSENTIE